jgi:hypothetical protein
MNHPDAANQRDSAEFPWNETARAKEDRAGGFGNGNPAPAPPSAGPEFAESIIEYTAAI